MTAVPTFTQVADGIWTATATIWTSLTTAVVAPHGACLLIDPGISLAELDARAHEAIRRGWRVTAGFATHPHWDHVLWHQAWCGAPRWATAEAVEAQRRTRDADLAAADAATPGHDPALFGRLTALPADATELPWDGPQAVIVRHRAHAPGHAALVLPHAATLLAGDMLSDLEIPLLDTDAADPLDDYRAALDTLERAAADHGVRTVIPGHGHVGDGAELARRLAADRRSLEALARGRTPDADRLRTPWLAEEHRKHVERLRH
ncbi:MBL fold metallo-hydrolase [Cellulomonas timonensis]|uniref:MBL fold metallo-hydrolase n=1 Tax=Cellulomonas timonensis TaxID=1689271 RepID=UPI000833F494|nr:MBL fold metallo-hydrolase [Cellulomonas timonensis]